MTTFFARVTDDHDAIAITMTPCAGQLYRWLLRQAPAGTSQELELQDFADWSALHRGGQSYSIRHIQRAFKELMDKELVEVIRRFTGRIFRLICRHPDQDKNVANPDQTVQTATKMSRKQASNPHSAVLSIETSKEDQQIQEPAKATSYSIPVQKEMNKEVDSPLTSPSKLTGGETKSDMPVVSARNVNPVVSELQTPISTEESTPDTHATLTPELEVVVKDVIAPAPLSANLAQLVSESCAETVLKALEVTKQAKNKGKLKNPSGFLSSAIRKGWQPKATTAEPTLELAGGTLFSQWFNLARLKGLVISASMINGVQHVCTNPVTFEWKPWREMADAFTLAYLQRMEPVKPIWWPNP